MRTGERVRTGSESDALAWVHTDAAAFFQAQLHAAGAHAAAARALLQARAVPAAAAAAYGLGYAPPGWTSLTSHLRALGHPAARLVAAGVSLPGRHGALLDRFRNRVIFPVHDPSGSHIIAFLGRLVPTAAQPAAAQPARPVGLGADGQLAHQVAAGAAAPKYLNSPQTASYRKGDVLYGLGADPARRALTAGAVPVLVEGPLDAIAVTWSHPPAAGPSGAWPADLPRYVGVAPCGTALTAAQVAVLQTHAGSLADRGIITAFDSDPAGADAGRRAFELLRAAGAWPTAAALPAGWDPAELTARHGPAALAAALRAAGPLADLVVDAQLEPWTDRLRWAEGRIGATRAAAHLLAGFPPEHVGRQVHRAAGRLGLTDADLTAALLEAVSPERPPTLPHLSGAPATTGESPAPTAARLAGASYPHALAGRHGPGPPGPGGPPRTALSTASRRPALPAAAATDRTTHH